MSAHHFHEQRDEPMRAEAVPSHRMGEGWVRIYIEGAEVVLFPVGEASLAVAQRIADAINEGGRAEQEAAE